MASTTPLPTIADRPHGDVLIYDGHCRFCRAQAERLARWDRKGRLAFLSLHDPEVAKRYPDLTHDFLMMNMVVVDQHGKRHAGAAAARYLSRHIPRLWLLAPFLHVPGSLPLWQWMYRQVAKRRYAIAGKDGCDGDACAIHFR